MNAIADLLRRIDEWAGEGVITGEQAATLRARVTEEAEREPTRRVQVTEILVYLGSLIIFLALAFLAILNWEELGSTGRILILLLPALAMFGLGWPLRTSDSARRQRGAQALWLGASLITGVFFLVLFSELELIDWRLRGPTDFYFLLSCLLAGSVSALAYTLLPTLPQSVPFHFWLTLSFISFLVWMDATFPPFNPWRTLLAGLLMGGLWLLLATWLQRRAWHRLAEISLLVGTITTLAIPFIIATDQTETGWSQTALEAISLALSLLFIAASVRFQSRTFLYSGAAFLLFFISYLNFEHFADDVGMPIALFLSGVALIVLGLGTGWLNRLMQRGSPAGR